MNICLEKVNKNIWYQDIEGNMVDENDPKAVVQVICFPLQLETRHYTINYCPKNRIIRFLCQRFLPIRKILLRNKKKAYHPAYTVTTSYASGSDCILEMVNSGDFTLEQAI